MECGKFGPQEYFGNVTFSVPWIFRVYTNGPCVLFKPNGPYDINMTQQTNPNQTKAWSNTPQPTHKAQVLF